MINFLHKLFCNTIPEGWNPSTEPETTAVPVIKTSVIPSKKPEKMWGAIAPDGSGIFFISYWRRSVYAKLREDFAHLSRHQIYRNGWRVKCVNVTVKE